MATEHMRLIAGGPVGPNSSRWCEQTTEQQQCLSPMITRPVSKAGGSGRESGMVERAPSSPTSTLADPTMDLREMSTEDTRHRSRGSRRRSRYCPATDNGVSGSFSNPSAPRTSGFENNDRLVNTSFRVIKNNEEEKIFCKSTGKDVDVVGHHDTTCDNEGNEEINPQDAEMRAACPPLPHFSPLRERTSTDLDLKEIETAPQADDDPSVKSRPSSPPRETEEDEFAVLDLTLSVAQKQTRCLNRIGTSYFRQGRLNDSLSFYKKALQALQSELGVHTDDTLGLDDEAELEPLPPPEDEGDYGFFASQTEDDDEDRMLEPRNRCQISTILLAQTLNNIGTVYWRRGDCKSAMPPLVDALNYLRQPVVCVDVLKGCQSSDSLSALTMTRHASMLSMSSSMGSIADVGAMDLGKKAHLIEFREEEETASSLSDRAVCHARRQLEISILKNIGIVHHLDNELAFAVASFSEALTQQQALSQECETAGEGEGPTEGYLNEIRIIGMIASALVKGGEYDFALRMHEHALKLKQKALGVDHPSAIVSTLDIANLQYRKGDYQEALKMYTDAHRMQLTALPPDHLDVGITLHHVGRVHAKLGKFRRAIKIFDDVRRIYDAYNLDERYCSMAALVRDTADAQDKMLAKSQSLFAATSRQSKSSSRQRKILRSVRR